MRLWSTCLAILLQALLALGDDGAIDFSKAPGGGVGSLRSCAQTPLAGSGYAYDKVWNALGCTLISCLCRPDLIKTAQNFIKDRVVDRCGAAADVDVQAAVKMYNDYCSSNGFAIPGYTYVSTQTVRVSATSGGRTAAAEASTTDPPGTRATDAVRTVVGVVTATSTTTAITTATAVVFRSAGSRVLAWPSFLYMFFAIA